MPRSSKPPDTCKRGGPKWLGILKFSRIQRYSKYLINVVFLVQTVSYGTTFFFAWVYVVSNLQYEPQNLIGKRY